MFSVVVYCNVKLLMLVLCDKCCSAASAPGVVCIPASLSIELSTVEDTLFDAWASWQCIRLGQVHRVLFFLFAVGWIWMFVQLQMSHHGGR